MHHAYRLRNHLGKIRDVENRKVRFGIFSNRPNRDGVISTSAHVSPAT